MRYLIVLVSILFVGAPLEALLDKMRTMANKFVADNNLPDNVQTCAAFQASPMKLGFCMAAMTIRVAMQLEIISGGDRNAYTNGLDTADVSQPCTQFGFSTDQFPHLEGIWFGLSPAPGAAGSSGAAGAVGGVAPPSYVGLTSSGLRGPASAALGGPSYSGFGGASASGFGVPTGPMGHSRSQPRFAGQASMQRPPLFDFGAAAGFDPSQSFAGQGASAFDFMGQAAGVSDPSLVGMGGASSLRLPSISGLRVPAPHRMRAPPAASLGGPSSSFQGSDRDVLGGPGGAGGGAGDDDDDDFSDTE